MANETIGYVICPIAGDKAEVRRDKRKKLYYLGAAGMIKPNLPAGQEWLLNNAVLEGKPAIEQQPAPNVTETAGEKPVEKPNVTAKRPPAANDDADPIGDLLRGRWLNKA